MRCTPPTRCGLLVAGRRRRWRSRWNRAAGGTPRVKPKGRLINIHGAVDLETGQTITKDVLAVDALSTILLLTTIEAMYPGMRWIHIFLDNARYHHAKLVQAWLAQPGRRIKLHFIPAYCRTATRSNGYGG